jgi:hypothetical protein
MPLDTADAYYDEEQSTASLEGIFSAENRNIQSHYCIKNAQETSKKKNHARQERTIYRRQLKPSLDS